jgi:predicted nuclease of predicted toxin-antitoxin system
MRLLLDSCVWGGTRAGLAAAGHVVWTGDWPKDPGDDEIMARAATEGRVLVTLDKNSANWPLSGAGSIAGSYGS